MAFPNFTTELPQHPTVIFITGSSATGKTSVCNVINRSLERLVHVEVDLIKHQIGRSHIEPWRPEARAQLTLAKRNVACLCLNYVQQNYSVLIDDVISPRGLMTYYELIGLENAQLVVLRAEASTLLKRDATRLEHKRMGDRIYTLLRVMSAYTSIGDCVLESGDSAEVTAVQIMQGLAANRFKLSRSALAELIQREKATLPPYGSSRLGG